MRLFVAIELPAQMRRSLVTMQKELMRRAEGSFVPTDNFHITLHFIGESSALTDAISAIQESVRGIRPFNLHLGGYNTFKKSGSCTSFVDIKGDFAELNALYESLQSAMYDRGFAREYKRFSPHVTLARSVNYNMENAEEQLCGISLNASMQVQAITLFESRRTPKGMQYIPLHREKLI